MIMKECNTLQKKLTKHTWKKWLLGLFLSMLCINILAHSTTDIKSLSPLTANGSLDYSQDKGFYLDLSLQLDEDYKAYVDQFDVLFDGTTAALKQEDSQKIEKSQRTVFKNIKAVKPFDISPTIEIKDRFSGGKIRKVIVESADLTTLLKKVPKQLPSSLVAKVRYQACTESHCLLPRFTSATITTSEAAIKMASTSSFEKTILNEGLLSLFLFVFLAGILTSFTPCIFPMIPITLSILGSQTVDQKSKLRGFILSTIYVCGIAITYAVMGLFAARSGALFGSALSQPLIVYSLAALFILMAMSMYGLYDLQLPGFLRNKLHAYKGDGGIIGAFFGGLISGVAAGPCVGPVLISILTHVAKTQEQFFGFWLLFVFAVGLGMIFIILGTFSSLLSRLPKSGPWLNTVKATFGFFMIIMALYYIEPVTDPTYFKIISGIVFIILGSIRGFIALKTLKTPYDTLRRVFAIMIILAGVGSMTHGLLETTHIVQQTDPLPSPKNDHFEMYSEEKLEKALLSGKPVIIDFYADWCLACKELDKYTFSKPDIQSLMSKFLLLKVDLTLETTENTVLREKYNVLGLPTILFIHPTGDVLPEETLTGFESAGQFKRRIERVLKTL